MYLGLVFLLGFSFFHGLLQSPFLQYSHFFFFLVFFCWVPFCFDLGPKLAILRVPHDSALRMDSWWGPRDYTQVCCMEVKCLTPLWSLFCFWEPFIFSFALCSLNRNYIGQAFGECLCLNFQHKEVSLIIPQNNVYTDMHMHANICMLNLYIMYIKCNVYCFIYTNTYTLIAGPLYAHCSVTLFSLF